MKELKNEEIPIIDVVPNGYYISYQKDNGEIISKAYYPTMKKYSDIASEYGLGKGQWLKLVEGDNKVRIVSDVETYAVHFVNKKPVLCTEGCELCADKDNPNKPRVQCLLWVIDRLSGETKILQIPSSVYRKFDDLSNNSDYSFDGLPPYDITITKTGTGLETKYDVIASRQDTELTEDEQKEVKALEPITDVLERIKSKMNQDYETK